MRRFLILLFFVFYLATEMSYAAPIIYRQQRMKAMQQQQEQEEYEQHYQQQGQQQGAQAQNQQQAAVQQTYQQQIDQRNQSIAQAILNANNQLELNQLAHGVNSASSNQVPQQAFNSGQPVAVQAVPSDNIKDEVDLAEVWKKLDTKSTIWTALIDDQAKLLTMSEYIDRFQKEGVKIQAPPVHYVQEIDQIVGANPQMLQRPFGELLQIAAIVDYDFDNGMDKDELAKKVLGEAGFEANKKRLTEAAQQQQPPGAGRGP